MDLEVLKTELASSILELNEEFENGRTSGFEALALAGAMKALLRVFDAVKKAEEADGSSRDTG